MIYYNDLPLDDEILKALGELHIDYVFQPIFEADGKLHILEVATFFGAMQAYQLRGYECRISLNSFPSEYFTLSEQRAFAVEAKREATSRQNLWIAIDDFGTGINSMDVVEMYDTKIVKLDRHMISGIDHEPEKQENVKKLVQEFHYKIITCMATGRGVLMMVSCNKSEHEKIMKGVDGAKITYWWDKAVDIIPAVTGKGIAVEKILRFYGFSKDEAMAFGDGENDMEMLEAVGTGIAMGNAMDSVKSIADYVCRSAAEDGVYHYCRDNKLIFCAEDMFADR